MALKAGGMKAISSRVNHDLRLERKFSPTLKAILGQQFIVQDPAEDLVGGSDFVVWTLSAIRVAVRLRTNYYYRAYPNEFTIRWSRPSGAETEIHKIRKGQVDYLLYGFVDEAESKIISFFIGDLTIFRRINPRPIGIYSNQPPDSQLAAFNLTQFPSEFVINRGGNIND